ncbi:2-dehydro-3-deoxygalactonokinase [Lewinella marina]|uniref:2-keto-3-deoxy-galactonokinase n=1 Tax=Neolewinella marina TaxID=438751 RepID=A0A2G0CAQ8_9BACT|nr:2-dehydro-3-deoxygalactonokinase [Neolewinella marina]NJB87846.1 2-dehydro-3-deoxygalactonokinase [Neolewinella marina]PHK97055.1 2-keto-3-deoxy-galactonokinase [Neolewinella marina]
MYFISCDWGTTNFRLRAVETNTAAVRAEWNTDQGIRATNEGFLASGQAGRFDFFAAYLSEQIDQLPAEYRRAPMVASGMASANIGMCELPYANLPINPSGDNLITRRFTLPAGNDLLLISGVRTADSIMRGEEVQALGLMANMPDDGTLILPGTHSKHLTYEGGAFTDFSTYLTGELFALLTNHGILSGSVAAGPFDAAAEAAFGEGVEQGRSGSLSRSLFGVRVRQVVHGHTPETNYYYLSGLLLGEELGGLANTQGTVYLAAAEPVFSLYHRALTTLVVSDRLRSFGGDALESALLAGQIKILLQHGG